MSMALRESVAVRQDLAEETMASSQRGEFRKLWLHSLSQAGPQVTLGRLSPVLETDFLL